MADRSRDLVGRAARGAGAPALLVRASQSVASASNHPVKRSALTSLVGKHGVQGRAQRFDLGAAGADPRASDLPVAVDQQDGGYAPHRPEIPPDNVVADGDRVADAVFPGERFDARRRSRPHRNTTGRRHRWRRRRLAARCNRRSLRCTGRTRLPRTREPGCRRGGRLKSPCRRRGRRDRSRRRSGISGARPR